MQDQWRQRLREMIDADGRSLRAISSASGNGPNFVQQMLKNEKDPGFAKLAGVLSVLGPGASVYVVSGARIEHQGGAPTPEGQLRGALLSYGVDGADLDQVLRLIRTYVSGSDEQPEQSRPGDQSQSASPRHEKEPSR